MASGHLPMSMLLIFMVLISLGCSGGNIKSVSAQNNWCVAKPSADNTALQSNIDFVCSAIDCSCIEEGGPCFDPNTQLSHASVAMNLYYQAKGKTSLNCDFRDSGLITLTDPSYGGCKYA